MRTLLIFTACLYIFLFGCIQDINKDNYSTFSTIREIHFVEQKIENNLVSPGELLISNERLIVFDVGSESFFHLFSKTDFRYLGALIRRGKGPAEEIFISSYFRSIGKDTIIYQNHQNIKFSIIEDNTDGLSLTTIDQIVIPESLRNNTDFFVIGDSMYSSLTGLPISRDFQGYCLLTGNVFEHGDLVPHKKPKYEDKKFMGFAQKITTVKPDRSLLATVYHNSPILRIYSAENWEKTAECQLGEILSGTTDGSYDNYWRIRSTNEFIYALYSKGIPPELKWDGGTVKYADVANEIHVWDWEGNPILKLILDRSIFSFDVTPDNKQLIALSIEDVDKLFLGWISWD